ncbi:MAG: glycosyltransferase involved in cell wall biosynthesis [Ilumatobacter sp.]
MIPRRGQRPARPGLIAHLTTVDMSLELLLRPQLDAINDRGGEAVGISAPGPYVKQLQLGGIRHVPLTSSTRGWNILSDLRAGRELWSALRNERPTVLHTHNPKPGLYGRVIGRLAGVPIVVNTVHGLYATETDRWLRRLVVYSLEAVASRFSDAELVQNAEDVATIKRLRLAPRSRVSHLGNGVNLERFRPDQLSGADRHALRSDWGIEPGEVVIGTVGRLVAEKGYPELFEAIGRLDRSVRLVVVGGDDPEKSDALPRETVNTARDAGVVFLGHRSDVANVLAGFDAFVLASHREGQPRAAMEAAACGLPVVATDIRGCRQVVDHDVSGLLVGVRDAQALAEAIGRLAKDKALRQRFGEAAVAKAHAEFDERRVIERVLSCYSEVADRKHVALTLHSGGAT